MGVGHKHRALPGSIVGALTNEGGLKGSDIGAIEIKPSFTLIGLPDDLSRGDLERLGAIEINGQRLDIRQDRGPKSGGERSDRGGYRGDDRRGGRSARPEHSGGHKKFTGGRKGSQRHGSR
jgi:ATP-dependent RNA helicase DeaD